MTSTNPVIQTAIRAAMETAIPEGSLTVSQWAARYRFIPPESVANPALAGRWRNEITPYLVAIMDAVTQAGINEIILIASSQVGKTESANNIIGYHIHIDPAKIIYCAETEPKAEAWGIEKFDPMVSATPELAKRVDPPKSRDKGNTMKRKIFRNGMLNIVHASSPSELSSRPARIIILDEEDAYLSTREGSPTELVTARMKTAGDQAKLIRITTPRTKETSPVFVAFQNSTQEKYFVPCPHCGEYQVLNWLNEGKIGCVKWLLPTGEDAFYMCEKGCVIDHDDKAEMLAKGEWRVTNPDYKGNRRGFWINEIYSPFTTWADMARGWLEAVEALRIHHDTSKMQVYLNTRLAQWWEDIGEQIDYQNLEDHVEIYEAEVPDGVLLLTGSADIQGNRIEAEIKGWGRDYESWRIARFVLYGDPKNPDAASGNISLPMVWEELFDVLDAEYEGKNGEVMKVRCATIDSGGHHTNEVYAFCKANAGRKWYAIKGSSSMGSPLLSKPSRNNKLGVRLYRIGTDTAKDTIFARLHISEPGPGYCHFPADPPQGEDFDAKYFQQLCSEKRITPIVNGQPRPKYVKVNPKGIESDAVRNEALDLDVYNLAAINILVPKPEDFRRWAKRRENLPQKTKISENNLENNVKVSQNLPKQPGVTVNKSGGGWANNW